MVRLLQRNTEVGSSHVSQLTTALGSDGNEREGHGEEEGKRYIKMFTWDSVFFHSVFGQFCVLKLQ